MLSTIKIHYKETPEVNLHACREEWGAFTVRHDRSRKGLTSWRSVVRTLREMKARVTNGTVNKNDLEEAACLSNFTIRFPPNNKDMYPVTCRDVRWSKWKHAQNI